MLDTDSLKHTSGCDLCIVFVFCKIQVILYESYDEKNSKQTCYRC